MTSNAYAVCHQVNCRNAMGAGIAKVIADKWPVVKAQYHQLCEKQKDPKKLLGTIQPVKISNGNGMPKYVVNIFGQDAYGRDGIYTDYAALTRAFKELNKQFAGKTVAFPYGFGCGLAGGDWQDVEKMMVHLLTSCHVQIYLKG